jgi:large subunit ribosomal protein L13Ae
VGTSYWNIEDDADFDHRLEERRKAKSAAYYERKKKTRQQIGQAAKAAKVDSKTKSQLEEYGY